MDSMVNALLINSYIATLMNPTGFLMNPAMSSYLMPLKNEVQPTQNRPLQTTEPVNSPVRIPERQGSAIISTPSSVNSTLVAVLPTAVSTPSSQTQQSTLANKPQRRFAPEITEILWNWFNEHIVFPYPDEEAVRMLTTQTGITGKQLRTWFLNRRRDYEKKHGFTRWNKMPAPPCCGKKRANPDASGGNVEPAHKRARKV